MSKCGELLENLSAKSIWQSAAKPTELLNVSRKVHRLIGEEHTNKPNTSAAPERDDIVGTCWKQQEAISKKYCDNIIVRDEGQISLDINYIATAAVQTKLRESRAGRTLSNIALLFNDSGNTMAAMECYVSGLSITAAVDAKITGSVTVEINGPVTWTTWTPA